MKAILHLESSKGKKDVDFSPAIDALQYKNSWKSACKFSTNGDVYSVHITRVTGPDRPAGNKRGSSVVEL